MVGLNEMDLKELSDKRLFEFIATGPKLDKENDTVPMDEVDKALLGWMRNNAPISEKHSNIIIGRGLTFKEDNEGNRVVIGEINEGKSADEAWKKIQSGEYSMVSIGGGAFEKTPNLHGGEDLKGLEILEVALCEEGMYPDANIIGKNELAKATPFFAKAKIILPVKNKDYVKGGEIMVEVEKGISREDFDALVKSVEELKRAKKQDEEEMPEEEKPEEEEKKAEESEEDKPEDEKKEVLVNGQKGIGGSSAVNPDEEGGTVIIPAGVQGATEPVGVAGTEDTDEEGVKITEKIVRKAIRSELAKAGVRKATTPVPAVEKTVRIKKSVNPAWEILKGRKSVTDFVRNTEIDSLQRKIDLRQAFESDMKDIRGGQ